MGTKIKKDGTLLGSTGPDDCALGPGAYFTSLPPQTSTEHLIENNWDGAAGGNAHKVESYIRINAHKVPVIDGRDHLHRDVFVVPERSVDLKDAGAKVGNRKWF